jgi:membrane fusion protein (multidrug efflux system)
MDDDSLEEEAPTSFVREQLDLEPATCARGSSPGPVYSPSVATGSSPSLAAIQPEAPAPAAAAAASPEARSPKPEAPAAAPASALPPLVQLPGGGISFDPHALPLPPELAPRVYGWLRRLALQTDLAGADRLLRDALVELTGSLGVLILYPGADGLVSMVPDDQIPAETQPIIAVARTRRALVTSHTALVPIATATETIAVIQLTRNPRQDAFGVPEQLAMAAIGRESGGVLHHLYAEHQQRQAERKADLGSLFRPEALENQRTRGQEGVLAELSPSWVKRAYPVLVAAFSFALVFAMFVHVPTYSSGSGIVVIDGKEITAPLTGTVDTVVVSPGDQVKAGQVLVRLRSDDVEAALRQANTELEGAVQQYLFDPTDLQIKKSLISAQAAAKRAQANVDERTLRAPEDGVVSDIRVRLGQLLQPGDHILTLVEPGTRPEIWAFWPGTDRPRLHAGQKLQVDLMGFTKSRTLAQIYFVDRDVIGTAAARRFLGAESADALKLGEGSYVLVKAHLPSSTFHAHGQVFNYHHGMPVKTEVRVEDKRFLVTLLPSLDKYLP